ncbi:MAG TPA: hypothetical protein VHG51_05410 [Longimicrobiaceae bacterium]|nr:hypothetical protein [Longimicrobiaceae bacterium]
MKKLPALLVLAACAGGGPGSPAPGARQETPRPDELARAAEDVVGFLRGQVAFDRIRLADTVVLYVAPEGGGARAALPRERLRDPAGWTVRSGGSGTAYSFAPPAGATELTTRPGRHLNCMEHPLASRFAELARLPHVGTRLQPPGAASCLQSWNLTLVFDPDLRPPTLVAVVHDRWEW